VLAAGYGDGLPRALSSRGEVWDGAQVRPVIGIVSMDLCAIQCAAETKVGDWLEFFGTHLDPWRQAKRAGTIPYELFTSVTARVDRHYA
jgi:alanine racemase